MLNQANTLKDYKLNSLDGEIGRVKEFYFDEKYWAIHYLVADTANWLTAGQVLISPYAQIAAIRDKQLIAIDLTKRQIEDSPSLDSDKPNPRQFEPVYYGYYGWPVYSGGPIIYGPHPCVIRDREQLRNSTRSEKARDLNLRSTHVVSGYQIQATDDEIGQVEDFIIDDETWMIRYLLINTLNRQQAKKILLSPHWIERVSWNEARVFVNFPRETIKRSPEYTEESMLTREYETALHQHYRRQEYWIDESIAS